MNTTTDRSTTMHADYGNYTVSARAKIQRYDARIPPSSNLRDLVPSLSYLGPRPVRAEWRAEYGEVE